MKQKKSLISLIGDYDAKSYMISEDDMGSGDWKYSLKREYLVEAECQFLDLEDSYIKTYSEFKYRFHKFPSCKRDVAGRINQGRRAMQMLNGVLWSKAILDIMKKGIHHMIIEGTFCIML